MDLMSFRSICASPLIIARQNDKINSKKRFFNQSHASSLPMERRFHTKQLPMKRISESNYHFVRHSNRNGNKLNEAQADDLIQKISVPWSNEGVTLECRKRRANVLMGLRASNRLNRIVKISKISGKKISVPTCITLKQKWSKSFQTTAF